MKSTNEPDLYVGFTTPTIPRQFALDIQFLLRTQFFRAGRNDSDFRYAARLVGVT
jgi:hypothetical protein